MYNFKIVEELAWAAAVGAGVFLLQVAAEFDPAVITDWTAWGIAAASGALRAAAGAVLARRSA